MNPADAIERAAHRRVELGGFLVRRECVAILFVVVERFALLVVVIGH